MIKSETEKIKDIFNELHLVKKRDTSTTKFDINLNSDNSIIVKGLNAIILYGIEKRASDIHLEPLRETTRVRYRIDGILYERITMDISLHSGLISRLKILSQLDITERKLPQDGKFRMEINNNYIDFRVSIVPLITGEKAVIRILDESTYNFSLENLGFSSEDYLKVNNLINHKNGIFLACGPTGSGKSSLIYSILKKLNDGKINISTVEDPVEYEIEGINQVQYNSEIGRDFSTILKAYLRQDPDVLMIGEIRDIETAEIAVKSALTGHLVLSTLHTNDSISSIFRLLNIGVERYMISASIIGIIAQRLVRKLCPHCLEIDKDFLPKLSLLKVQKNNYLLGDFFTARGCEKCNHSGYSGRTAIFEIFMIDDEIRYLIDSGATLQELEDRVKKNGMKTLIEDGVEKALQKLTSLDEILRQC